MQGWKLAGGVAALVAAGVFLSALPGSAQKSAARDKSAFGFVDLGEVTEKIKATDEWKVNVRKFSDEQAKFRNELEEMTRLRFLTPAEIQELQNLRAKATATDGEKNRIRELEDKSSKLDKEYQELAMVEKPSTVQGDRLKALTQARENASTKVQEEAEKKTLALQKLEGQMLEAMQSRILKVVEQVAKGEGVSVVIDRQAILYGGQDLTQDVLKKLGS